MQNATLEICCGSAEDVFQAKAAGADRVELNAALFLGGLTPSLGTVRAAKKAGIPIMVMVRPREGGFCYTEQEFHCMLEDIRIFTEEGVDGLVFGILRPDGRIDAERCGRLLEACGTCETVFHRAIDVVPDWREGLDTLITLGFTRVLTSGQAPSAWFGAETIRQMNARANGRIEILAGGGIRPNNIARVAEATGCRQFHASAGARQTDPSCHSNPEVHFGGALYPPEDQYSVTAPTRVQDLRAALLK